MTTEAYVKLSADASGVASGVDAAVRELNRLPPSAKAISDAMSNTQSAFKATGSTFQEVAATAAKSASSMHGSAGAIRESMVLVREAANQNWTRFAGSLSLLAQYTGALSLLMNPLAIGLIAVGTAIGGVAFAANQGAENQIKLQNALTATNQWAGLTEGQLHALAGTLGTETKEGAGKARDALSELVRQGQLTGPNLQLAARAALDMARAMGGEASTYTKQLSALQTDTVGTTMKLQQQFHMLTATQFEHVIALVKAADASGDFHKRQEAIQTVISALDGPIQKQTENTGYLAQAWRGVSQAIGGAVEQMMNWGRVPDTSARLREAQAQLVVLQEQASSHSGRTAAAARAQLATQQALVASLQQQVAAQQEAAAAGSAQAQSDAERIEKQYQAYLKSLRGPKAPKSRTGEWQADLDDQLASERQFFAESREEEVRFWRAKLAIPSLTKDERRQIIKTLYGLEKTEARAAYADTIAEIRTGEQGKTEALRSALTQQKAAFDQSRDTLRQQANEQLISKQREYSQLVQISKNEAAAEIANFNAVHSVRVAALAAQLAAANRVGADTRKIWAEIVADAQTTQAQLAAITAQGSQRIARDKAAEAKAMFEPMNQAIKSFSDNVGAQFGRLVTGQQNAATTFKGVWNSSVMSVEQSFANSASRMLQTQLRNLLLGQQAEKVSGASEIRTAASVAAGNAYKATVGIPIIGPVLAPAAAATAFAGVLAFMPSASGGYDIGNENPIAQLHKREMVLPEGLADRVRNMTDKGGSGDVHIHVNAMDARSFAGWLQNGGGGKVIMKHLNDARRNNMLPA